MSELKGEARKMIAENIRMRIESESKSSDANEWKNGKEQLQSSNSASLQISANIEIVGIKTDAYYDKAANTVYAFAYANKYEVIGYYKANINMLVGQAEGSLHAADQLEKSGEKVKARKQCEDVMPLLEKVRYAQDLLIAIDGNTDRESLQMTKSESMRNTVLQMQARLAQGVYICVESIEEIFGEKVDIIANKLKAVLSNHGCSFVDDAAQADFKLALNASAREASNSDGLVYCYADVKVALFDVHKQKSVYEDMISQRNGSTNRERAGRKALESVIVTGITDKLMPWIKN
jgi:hypothetical protein